MDDRTYAGYLVFAVLGSAFILLWNYFFITAGFYHRYISAVIGVFSLVWFSINLSLIFIEGLDNHPDARKLFLPVWFVIGFIAACVHAVYNLSQAPSWLMVGTTFATWWIIVSILASLVELFVANLILIQMNE